MMSADREHRELHSIRGLKVNAPERRVSFQWTAVKTILRGYGALQNSCVCRTGGCDNGMRKNMAFTSPKTLCLVFDCAAKFLRTLLNDRLLRGQIGLRHWSRFSVAFGCIFLQHLLIYDTCSCGCWCQPKIDMGFASFGNLKTKEPNQHWSRRSPAELLQCCQTFTKITHRGRQRREK